jgi:murein DD-endopeptidase MepM/ murein hydrolase activator NlpD
VVLTGRGFKLHGNCVAVDHGQGVVSFYIHLKSISVQKGPHVKAGETLGKVGQTGRANGPHLHFSIYVNQVATNPTDWFDHAF